VAGLNAIVENINDVEEAFRPLYVEEKKDNKPTGRWVIAVNGGELEDNVKGLKQALQSEKDEAKRLKTLADKFKGIDPEKYEQYQREAREAQEREERLRLEQESRERALREELDQKHQKVVNNLKREIEDLRGRWHSTYRDNLLVTALSTERGAPELLLTPLRERVRVEEKDGKLTLTVLDKQGEPAKTDKGEPLDLGTLVKEFAAHDVYGKAFEGSGAAGSGTNGSGRQGGGGGGKSDNPWKTGNLTEQGRIFRENPALAQSLSREAGKPLVVSLKSS
jgi:hypothetical protein